MRKKLLYSSLIVLCLSFFSFCDAGTKKKCICLQQCKIEKNTPEVSEQESNLSPLYHFLKI